MAKKQVLMVECDKCKTTGEDPTKFLHVIVATIPPLDDKKAKSNVVSEKDLCLRCVGAPGVNVEP